MSSELFAGQQVLAFSNRWTPEGWEPVSELAVVVDPCVSGDPDYDGLVEIKIARVPIRIFVSRDSVTPAQELWPPVSMTYSADARCERGAVQVTLYGSSDPGPTKQFVPVAEVSLDDAHATELLGTLHLALRLLRGPAG